MDAGSPEAPLSLLRRAADAEVARVQAAAEAEEARIRAAVQSVLDAETAFQKEREEVKTLNPLVFPGRVGLDVGGKK
jgi:hypothetical protein